MIVYYGKAVLGSRTKPPSHLIVRTDVHVHVCIMCDIIIVVVVVVVVVVIRLIVPVCSVTSLMLSSVQTSCHLLLNVS